jgi:peptide/nickel transport system substrate-binding protein
MIKRLLTVLCPALLLAALCAGGAFAAAPAGGQNADITVVQALDIIGFDPAATSDLNNQYVMYNLYSRLFTFPTNRLAGDVKELCKEFKRVSDTEWHFTIWDNVKFHDGSTLTVDDVVYSLNRAKAGTAIGAIFKPVKSITKISGNVLSITTDGPYPAMTSALTHAATCIVPKAYAEKAEQTKDWSKPIGSGRYTFVNRVIGDSVKLERFDGYFNKDELARNKSVTIKVIP